MIKRYAQKEITDIWDTKKKYEIWLKIELLAIDGMYKVGIIPEEDYTRIKQAKLKINVNNITQIEKTVKHDIIAFLQSITSQLGKEQRWIHFGMTSSDVLDTCLGYQIHLSNTLLNEKIWSIFQTLKQLIKKYKNVPILGRTHGINAEITTIGHKLTVWYDIWARAYRAYNLSRVEVESAKISGSVGNFAHIPISVQEYVCEQLGLNSAPIATQILSRDRYFQYFSNLSQFALAMELMATEVRLLQQSELNEVSEKFTSGQKGSSAMPHKQNPISAENICGLSRLAKGYLMTSSENINLWHERDISHSSNERFLFPDMIGVIYYMLLRTNKMLSELVFNKNQITKNINKCNNIICSQAVMLALIQKKQMTRQDAYEFIQKAAFIALKENKNFRQVLIRENIGLSNDELDACFDLSGNSASLNISLAKLNIKL